MASACMGNYHSSLILLVAVVAVVAEKLAIDVQKCL
jgi:hypothetical protein